MAYRIIIFLFVNFMALGLGSWMMGEGSSSEWYQNIPGMVVWISLGYNYDLFCVIYVLCMGN